MKTFSYLIEEALAERLTHLRGLLYGNAYTNAGMAMKDARAGKSGPASVANLHSLAVASLAVTIRIFGVESRCPRARMKVNEWRE
ncbi:MULTISPECIES: hypothetical protein [Rhodomicrobium]|uniref:hypothetical protein n=1 Tax=Rhodomicrobium TaxID=1068 RepID=UPI000F742173|nr:MULTISPECIES: hypothetical protein [Rhodomicrobium]